MDLDIVLLPPKILATAMVQIVRPLKKKFPLTFLVDNKKLSLHLSLYHLKVKDAKVPKLIKQLDRLSEQQARIKLRITRPGGGKNFFSFKTDRPKVLSSLQKIIIKSCSGYRSGMVVRLRTLKIPMDREYVKKYGIHNIFKNFDPHITLGHTKGHKDIPAIISELKMFKHRKIVFSSLALTKVDKYGQVIKIIKKFNLN